VTGRVLRKCGARCRGEGHTLSMDCLRGDPHPAPFPRAQRERERERELLQGSGGAAEEGEGEGDDVVRGCWGVGG
jgi:hypothetical protein